MTSRMKRVESHGRDPVLQALADAPEDDEPWTAQDDAAVAESRADFDAGRTATHQEMLRMYG